MPHPPPTSFTMSFIPTHWHCYYLRFCSTIWYASPVHAFSLCPLGSCSKIYWVHSKLLTLLHNESTSKLLAFLFTSTLGPTDFGAPRLQLMIMIERPWKSSNVTYKSHEIWVPLWVDAHALTRVAHAYFVCTLLFSSVKRPIKWRGNASSFCIHKHSHWEGHMIQFEWDFYQGNGALAFLSYMVISSSMALSNYEKWVLLPQYVQNLEGNLIWQFSQLSWTSALTLE
mgnify:CR=1 FL=1